VDDLVQRLTVCFERGEVRGALIGRGHIPL
jgi:hypothetical protein